MKTKDIANKYNINKDMFEKFLEQNNLEYKLNLTGFTVSDDLVEQYVNRYNKVIQRKQEEEQEKKREMSKMLISSGFNFDGYKIVKYSGYISGDDAVQIPRSGVFGGDNGSNLTDALVKIRRRALSELKEAAYNLGCNAVIGVDFDYITLEPESVNITGGTLYEPYIICVTANGNAVCIEKIE